MKLFKTAVLLISFLALTACGNKPGGNNNKDTSNVIPSSVPTEHSTITGNIGASGGEVKDPENNVTINIPAGALQSETNITATYIESPEILSNKISTDFLGAAEFGPDGTTFAKPVSVTINLNKTPKNSSLAVFCYSAQYDVWEYVTDATPNGNKATFEVTHFSTYQVMDRTKDFLNEWTNMVRSAKVNGTSDADLLQAFRDYLVNEVHILDQYTTYNGYWYEPCGLFIAGNYHINGVEGDPNNLIRMEGEENKVGNKYGLCQIDGATSSRLKKDNAKESQEIFDILVLVEYKLIKPDIELSASKKKLNKGETATISIRCHYTNVANFYEEYKDLALADYFLTIKKPSHFTVDKTSVLTDANGRASFKVTANESGQAETITVNFDVSGDFGVHAEGNITLNSGGGDYDISGHIVETLSFNYDVPVASYSDSYTQAALGTFSMKVEYDFEGSIKEEENGMTGSLEFSNAVMTYTSTRNDYLVNPPQVGYAYYDVFGDEQKSYSSLNPSFEFTAEVDENGICILTGSDIANDIVHATGSGATYVEVGDGVEINVKSNTPHTGTLAMTSKSNLLLGFTLAEGTYTNTSTTLKDKFDGLWDIKGSEATLADWNLVYSSWEESTVQTITVAPASI